MTLLPERVIGDRRVSAIGLGTAAMSLDDAPDDERSVRTIRDAIDAGVLLIDTAHAYTTRDEPTHSESLVRKAVAGHPSRDQLLIATKGGHWRSGHSEFPIDGRPETLRAHLDASLRALDVDVVDLYQLHHPDPNIPIEESVGALSELQTAGLLRMIGISNVDQAQFERAIAVAPIVSVQNHFSPFRTDDLEFIEALADLGVAFLGHSPFGGWSRGPALGDALPLTTRAAQSRGRTLEQVILAWELGLSPAVVPIVGARRSASIQASAVATRIILDPDDERVIRDEIAAMGSRRDA